LSDPQSHTETGRAAAGGGDIGVLRLGFLGMEMGSIPCARRRRIGGITSGRIGGGDARSRDAADMTEMERAPKRS
jgi:hypothetical protein